MMHYLDRQILKQGEQLLPRVGAHVPRQPISQDVWQVVDQGNVARMVPPAPVDAVGLPWPKPIGNKDSHVLVGPRDAYHFSDDLQVVIDMFEHFVAKDYVKRIIGKGQPLANSLRDPLRPSSSLHGPLKLNLDAVHLR
jgi:hypothetical protein